MNRRLTRVAVVGALVGTLLSGAATGYLASRGAVASDTRVGDLSAPPVLQLTARDLKEALVDGRLTVDEFNAGVQLTVDCLRAEGFDADVVPGKGLRPNDVTFLVPDADGQPDRETVGAAQSQADHCIKDYLGQYQIAWMRQGLLDPIALKQALASLSACMRSAGAPFVESDMSFDQLNEYLIVRGDGRSPASEQWYRHYVPCRIALEEEQGFRFP